MKYPHRPVLLEKTLHALLTDPNGLYVDGTVGPGGHSEGIARKLGSEGRLVCLDRDGEAVSLAQKRLSTFGEKVTVLKDNFGALPSILKRLGLTGVDGVLLDLGISSYQIEQSGRGFSFSREEPLDMRMDQVDQITAEHLINRLPARDLEGILRRYGEEHRARRIVEAVVRQRGEGEIRSSLQLARLIESSLPRSYRPSPKHPATRSFQALRIAVNKELENLADFLKEAPSMIKKGGRMVVLSYHSLEDRLVKQAMAGWEKGCTCPPDLPRCACGKIPLFRRLWRKGIRPGQEEVSENPRARSATLRAAERI